MTNKEIINNQRNPNLNNEYICLYMARNKDWKGICQNIYSGYL